MPAKKTGEEAAVIHCTDQFWYRWCPNKGMLPRHTYDATGTACPPLSSPNGTPLSSRPLFLGGVLESSDDQCVTDDLQWKVDLKTMRACRLHSYTTGSCRALCGCPRAQKFIALMPSLGVPLMYINAEGWKWLPAETEQATRAAPCDPQFNRIALFMAHTCQIVVWDRPSNKILRFARCPGILDFVTCCHTSRIYAITYETSQRLLTFDAKNMVLSDETHIAERSGLHDRVYANPCFPSAPTTPTFDPVEQWSVCGTTVRRVGDRVGIVKN